MLSVLTCITAQHDWRLVVLAGLICLGSVLITFELYAKLPKRDTRARLGWLAVTGLVAGSGVWATHFVAMLAFEPSLRTGYDPDLTLISWMIAVVLSGVGFAVAASSRIPRRAAVGGAVLGLGVGLMHYVGMAAFRTQGVLLWNRDYVVASLILGIALAVAAMEVAKSRRGRWRGFLASLLLTLAICGLHFTGMAAVKVLPDPGIAPSVSTMSHAALGVSIAALAALVIAAIVVTLVLNTHNRRRAFSHLRDAVDAMPDGLAIYDAADRLLTWNDRYRELLALTRSDLKVGLDYETLLRRLVQRGAVVIEPGTEEAWTQSDLSERRTLLAAREQQLTSGRWLRVEHRPTRSGGLVSVCVDVTDLKRNAEALSRARDDAEAANRAKTEFLANMSHEIRTPMNGIMGMNALMLRSPLSARQRTFAEAIASSADALMVIITDILDVSKLEAGTIKLNQADFSLESVIHQVIEQLSPAAVAKRLDVTALLDVGARGRFEGDPQRLRQVLTNLLSNAIKFTAEGSARIEVRSRQISTGRMHLHIDVLDTGIGVAPDDKSKLFQKFQQADGSITRQFGGTGLGLSISRELVELMGGHIGVESRAGGGSVFWFEIDLPVATITIAPPVMARA